MQRDYYVHALAYPDGRLFYIGKGKGNRISEHENEARKGIQSAKCQVIREIWSHGEEVTKIKLAFFVHAEEAFRYEASLISSLNGLSNVAQGRKHIRDLFITTADLQRFGSSIRQRDEDGTEYWSAREMADFLGYTTWKKFQKLITRVENICQIGGWDINKHFIPTYKIAPIGRGGKRSIDDYHLSREAFLMVIQNADPEKLIVSIGKQYIVLQTLHFQERMNSNKNVEDLVSNELAANAFRASLAKQKIEREQIHDKDQTNAAHHEMGQEVRTTIIRAGATLPEELPTPQKSIKQLEQEEQRHLKYKDQLSLFDQPSDDQK